jgi:hypothetical protein
MILNYVTPFDLLRLRRVNRQMHLLGQRRLNALIYFDVVKCDLGEILPDEQQTDGEFHRHRKSNLLLHMDERSVILVVEDRWTSRDVYTLWGAIQAFAPFVRCLTLDVHIAELVCAALSSVKLSRWYAFQCYIQALGSPAADDMHMKSSNKPVTPRSTLFPQLKEITLRTMPSDLAHLSRMPDYGVSPSSLYVEESLELLRVNVIETRGRASRIENTPPRGGKRPHHHLRTFKTWLRANELKEKYVQQYSQ